MLNEETDLTVTDLEKIYDSTLTELIKEGHTQITTLQNPAEKGIDEDLAWQEILDIAITGLFPQAIYIKSGDEYACYQIGEDHLNVRTDIVVGEAWITDKNGRIKEFGV